MRLKTRHFRLVATAAAISAGLLVTACGGSSENWSAVPSPTTTASVPVATSEPASERPIASGECEEAVAAIAEAADQAEGPSELTDATFAFGSEAPQHCDSLRELHMELDQQLGGDAGGALAEMVIYACVAGDAWAVRGEASAVADTALCKEARSNYTVVDDQRLVPAQATFADDFNGSCDGWSTDRDERVVLSCARGAYRVLVRNPDRPQQSRLFDLPRLPTMSVEADAVLVKPRNVEYEFHGVTCWGSPTVGYLFVLGPDGSYAILKEDHAAGERTFLKDGSAEHAIPGVGVRNRIRGDCEADRSVVKLALFVNGSRVAVARDKEGGRSFSGFGLFVGTSEPGTEVLFDNVLVRGAAS